LNASKHFWLSTVFVKCYCPIIVVLIALQIASIVVVIKYGLFSTYNLEARDVFMTKDIRTQKLDVETRADQMSKVNAEYLRNQMTTL
jgi:hypothetical protein